MGVVTSDSVTLNPVRGVRRSLLWTALVLLVLALLAMLVWLAGLYEASQVQSRLERDLAETAADLRTAFNRDVQSLQALQFSDPTPNSWNIDAASLLREHRQFVRLEWRDLVLRLNSHVDTPFRPPLFDRMARDAPNAELTTACAKAREFNGPAYAASYFVPQADGMGLELVELCLPLQREGQAAGFLVATYALQEVLESLLARPLVSNYEISFTEPDGTRLALRGTGRRGRRVFTAQQLMDLPGATLVLRMDSWRAISAPSSWM